MSDAFWNFMGIAISHSGEIVAALGILYGMIFGSRVGKKVDAVGAKTDAATKAALSASDAVVASSQTLGDKVDLNTQLTHAAAMTKQQADLIVAGAEHANIQKGIDIAEKRASGFDSLRTNAAIDVSKP